MDVNNIMRSRRINPASLPLADGGGSGASRKPATPAPAPARKPSKDERAPDVVAGTSRLAPYFPRTSLENRPASSSASLVCHHHRHRYNVVAMHTSHSQGPDLGGGGGSGIASPAVLMPLQWGHGKRSRSCREAPVATPAPEPELTPAEVRRRASLKFRYRKAAKAQARAVMPPPPGARVPNLVAAPSLPPRAGSLWLHGYPRIIPDSFSLADGAGSSLTSKPLAPTSAPTPSKHERAPVVVVDTSGLAPYFAGTSPEHHMPRGHPTASSAALVSHRLYNLGMHTYQEPNAGGGGDSGIARTSLEQQRPWGHAPHRPQPAYSPAAPLSHHLYNVGMHASQSQGPSVGGGGGEGIAAPDAHAPLRWGHSKRSRSRREVPTPTPAPAPELTPTDVQTQAAAVKMRMPSGARDPNLIATPLLPPRAITLSLRSSSEEPHTAAGEQQPAAKEEEKQPPAPNGEPTKQQQQPQRQASIKSTEKQKGKAPMVEVPPDVKEKEEKAPMVEVPPDVKEKEEKAPMVEVPPDDKEKEEKAPMVEVPPDVKEKAAMARPVVPRIVTQLTRDEKEEDWLAMTGTKLPRRPHGRPEIVQEQVANIYPGKRLSQVNMARYKVTEKKSKRVGGLKGMAMDDNDSD